MRQKLTTDDVEPQRRRDYWRSSLSEMYAPLDIKDCEDDGFGSEIVSTQVGGLNIAKIDGVGQTISRPKTLIKSSNCDDYVAVVQLNGPVNHSTNGHDTVTGPGSITLYDLTCPYELQSSSGLSIIDVSISRTALKEAFGPASRCVGLSLGPTHSSTPTILAFFQSLSECGHLADEQTASRMATIGTEILVTGFAERLATEPLSRISAATYLYRAKVFIDANLGRSSLNVRAIAAALNVSVRRLHSVFAENDLTVDSYIWERRLEKAGRLLRDPAHDLVPITSIGYQVGFSDQSHFAHRFRRRYAVTASDYREEARAERARAAEVDA